jgi:hypothetical protein
MCASTQDDHHGAHRQDDHHGAHRQDDHHGVQDTYDDHPGVLGHRMITMESYILSTVFPW